MVTKRIDTSILVSSATRVMSVKDLTSHFVPHVYEKSRRLANLRLADNGHATQHNDRENQVPKRSNKAPHDVKHDKSGKT